MKTKREKWVKRVVKRKRKAFNVVWCVVCMGGRKETFVGIVLVLVMMNGCSVFLAREDSVPEQVEEKVVLVPGVSEEVGKENSSADVPKMVGPFANQTAPDFVIKLVDGNVVSSEVLEKKGVVLYSFATYCLDCLKELDDLKKVYPLYRNKVEFVGMSVDGGESAEDLMKFVRGRLYSFDVAVADKQVMVAFQVTSPGMKVGVGKDGIIKAREDVVFDQNDWKDLFKSVA